MGKVSLWGSGVVVLSAIISAGAFGAEPAPTATNLPITNFHVVVSGKIDRGARPDLKGMQALAAAGIKTDIDLEDDDDAIAAEKEMAAQVGITNFVSEPMSGFWAPDDSEVNDVISRMEDDRNYPLYVHCQHGQDRTGMIVGIYRVSTGQMTPDQAYDEATSLGFHWELVPLMVYFKNKMDAAYAVLHPGG